MFTAPSTSIWELANLKELSTPNLCFGDIDVYGAESTDTCNSANKYIFMKIADRIQSLIDDEGSD